MIVCHGPFQDEMWAHDLCYIRSIEMFCSNHLRQDLSKMLITEQIVRIFALFDKEIQIV